MSVGTAVRTVLTVLVATILLQGPTSAQSATDMPPPAKLKQLVDLLRDPEIAKFLETKAAQPTAPGNSEQLEDDMSRAERFVRGQVEMLAGAVPKMPGEAAAASRSSRGTFAVTVSPGSPWR